MANTRPPKDAVENIERAAQNVRQASEGVARGTGGKGRSRITPEVSQLVDTAVQNALGGAARDVITGSIQGIENDLKKLNTLVEAGKEESFETKQLREAINSEARHTGALILTFEKDMGHTAADGLLKGLNNMIETYAEGIYKTKGHVTYQNLSAVHDVKEHIRSEIIQPGDITSIMDNVKAKLGEDLMVKLSSIGIDFDRMDEKLLAIREARRDRLSTGNAESEGTFGRIDVAQLQAEERRSAAPRVQHSPHEQETQVVHGPRAAAEGEVQAQIPDYALVNVSGRKGVMLQTPGASFKLDDIYSAASAHLGNDKFSGVYFATESNKIYLLDEARWLTTVDTSRQPGEQFVRMKIPEEMLEGKPIVIGQSFITQGTLDGKNSELRTTKVTTIVPVTAQTHDEEVLKDLPKVGIKAEFDRRLRESRRAHDDAVSGDQS